MVFGESLVGVGRCFFATWFILSAIWVEVARRGKTNLTTRGDPLFVGSEDEDGLEGVEVEDGFLGGCSGDIKSLLLGRPAGSTHKVTSATCVT